VIVRRNFHKSDQKTPMGPRFERLGAYSNMIIAEVRCSAPFRRLLFFTGYIVWQLSIVVVVVVGGLLIVFFSLLLVHDFSARWVSLSIMPRQSRKDQLKAAGVIEINGWTLLDLNVTKLKGQWAVRGLNHYDAPKPELIRGLWPDAPRLSEVSARRPPQVRRKNIFDEVGEDVLINETREQILARYRACLEVGAAIFKKNLLAANSKSKRVAMLKENGTLPRDASDLMTEVIVKFCEYDSTLGCATNKGRSNEQRKRKLIGLVDQLGGGDYKKEHEKMVIERRCFTARKLAAMVDTYSGFNYETVETLRDAAGEKGTLKKRKTGPSLFCPRPAVWRLNETLNDEVRRLKMIQHAPDHEESFEPGVGFWGTYRAAAGFEKILREDPRGGWWHPLKPRPSVVPIFVKISYDELPFESHTSSKPGMMAGHAVMVDTRFLLAKFSPQASNTVVTFVCYIVYPTVKPALTREKEEGEEEDEEYDLEFDALEDHPDGWLGSVSPTGWRTKREQIGARVGDSIRKVIRAEIKSMNGPGEMQAAFCNDKVSVLKMNPR
jgi:hypothetical protein